MCRFFRFWVEACVAARIEPRALNRAEYTPKRSLSVAEILAISAGPSCISRDYETENRSDRRRFSSRVGQSEFSRGDQGNHRGCGGRENHEPRQKPGAEVESP